MSHFPKLKGQPLCLWCDRKIAKATQRVYIGDLARKEELRRFSICDQTVFVPLDQWPKTKADCEKLTNLQVVSVDYSQIWNDNHEIIGRQLRAFGTWDGESYDDEFFCTGSCCKAYAYKMARLVQKHKEKP